MHFSRHQAAEGVVIARGTFLLRQSPGGGSRLMAWSHAQSVLATKLALVCGGSPGRTGEASVDANSF